MKINNFEKLIMSFLKNQIVDIYEGDGSNDITVNLKDVNFEIQGLEWEKSLLNYLNKHDYSASFSYGDGNWVTIHKKS